MAERTESRLMDPVLVVGHYPLDRLDRAPKVRTYHMAAALARRVPIRLIAGTRRGRVPALLAWSRPDRLHAVAGVYVESASSTMTPVDWLFLRAVRRTGLPLAIFVRDWYQRFPDLYPPAGLKEWAMARLYALTLHEYRRLATTLFVPSRGFLSLLPHPAASVLPPAGMVLDPPPVPRHPHRVVYVGANGSHDGVDRAVEALATVVDVLSDLELVLVLRRREWPPAVPPWCRLVEAAGPELDPWLWSSSLALIPRRDTAYHRLAVPVKLFDYWSHGLPVVVTGAGETAALVSEWGAGLAVPDDPEALADAVRRLLADGERLAAMRTQAFAAVREAHNWDARAHTVLQALNLTP